MLVGPWALEQLVSLERLTYVAYFVLLTCFLIFVQNEIFYLRCVLSNQSFLPSKQSNKTLGVRTVALADCSIKSTASSFTSLFPKVIKLKLLCLQITRNNAAVRLLSKIGVVVEDD